MHGLHAAQPDRASPGMVFGIQLCVPSAAQVLSLDAAALEVAALEVRHAEHLRRVEVTGDERERLVAGRDRSLEAAGLLVRERTGGESVQRPGNCGRPRADRTVALLVAPAAAAGARRVAGRGRR